MTIEHRHGGTITKLHAVGHTTRKGVADWYFIGDVDWRDGSQSRSREIAPGELCGEPEELAPFLAQLNTYLAQAGKWHEPKHKRDGRIVFWTPHRPAGTQDLS